LNYIEVQPVNSTVVISVRVPNKGVPFSASLENMEVLSYDVPNALVPLRCWVSIAYPVAVLNIAIPTPEDVLPRRPVPVAAPSAVVEAQTDLPVVVLSVKSMVIEPPAANAEAVMHKVAIAVNIAIFFIKSLLSSF
jgi:hypothetical protein